MRRQRKKIQGFDEHSEEELNMESLRAILKKSTEMKTDGLLKGVDVKKTNIPKLVYIGKYFEPEIPLQKGTAPSNYRTITCLPMTWKILTAQIS